MDKLEPQNSDFMWTWLRYVTVAGNELTLKAHVVCLYSVKHSLHLHSTFSGSSSSFYVTCVILKQSLKFECAPKTRNKTPH